MVSGNGVTVRFGTSTSGLGCRRTLHYILQWAIVLDKVKVCGGDRSQRNAQIPYDRDRLQEYFRQEHGRAPIQVYATRVHFFHQPAEQPEIPMRGCAKR